VYIRKYADKEPTTTISKINNDLYKITIHNPNSYPLKDFQVKVPNPSFITSKFEGLKISPYLNFTPNSQNTGFSVGILVNNKNNIYGDEQYIINLVQSLGYNVKILDADDYTDFQNYKVLIMVTGKEPTEYDNDIVINALKNAISHGTCLLVDYKGVYLPEYMNIGAVKTRMWYPCVHDAIYFVKPITYHPILKTLPTWDPPEKPDREDMLIHKLKNPGTYKVYEVSFYEPDVKQIRFYYLYVTYGWDGQHGAEEYSYINKPDRAVHKGEIIEKDLGKGCVIFLGLNKIPTFDYYHGPIEKDIINNAIKYCLAYCKTSDNLNEYYYNNKNNGSTQSKIIKSNPDTPTKSSANSNENSELAVLYIESDPNDANVFINGEYKGITPIKLELKSGTYTIKIKKEGYNDVSEVVRLTPGEIKTLNIEFKKISMINELITQWTQFSSSQNLPIGVLVGVLMGVGGFVILRLLIKILKE